MRDEHLVRRMMDYSLLTDKNQIIRWARQRANLYRGILRKIWERTGHLPDDDERRKIFEDVGTIRAELMKRFQLNEDEAWTAVLRLPHNGVYEIGDPLKDIDESVRIIFQYYSDPASVIGYTRTNGGTPLYCIGRVGGRDVYEQCDKEGTGKPLYIYPVVDFDTDEIPGIDAWQGIPEEWDHVCEYMKQKEEEEEEEIE